LFHAIPILTNLSIGALPIIAANIRVIDALTVSANLAGRTLIIIRAAPIRYAETEFTLLPEAAIIIRRTFRGRHGHADPRQTTEPASAVVVGLTAIWHLADIIDALHIRDRAIACVLTEERRYTPAGDAG